MQLGFSVPLDGTFLRRECPSCNREFKWHSGPAPNRPADAVDPPFYYCPYCGTPASSDDWWTKDQLEYAQQLLNVEGARLIDDEARRLVQRHRSGPLKVTIKPGNAPVPPAPLVEKSDMVAVASPCHPWEPIKLIETWVDPVHCLICGELFAIS